MRKVINAELLAKFSELVGDFSYSEIAKELGVSKAVVFKMSRILHKKPTEEQKRANKLRAHAFNPNVERFLELADSYSYSEIASIMGVSVPNVKYYAFRAGFKRDKKKASELLSKVTSAINKSERRKMIFGLEQKTKKHLVLDKNLSIRKQKYRNGFRAYGYIVDIGSNEIFIPKDIKRYPRKEANATALGFKFIEI